MKSINKFKKKAIKNTNVVKGGHNGLAELAEELVNLTVKDVKELS